MKAVLAFLFVIVTGIAEAGSIAIVAPDMKPGRYVILVDVATDGTIKTSLINSVVMLGEDGKTDPDVPKKTNLYLAARDSVKNVPNDVQSRAASLALIYGTAANKTGITGTQLIDLVRETVKAVLGEKTGKAWSPWFSKVDDELKKLDAAGKFDKFEDVAAAYKQIAAGLRDSGFSSDLRTVIEVFRVAAALPALKPEVREFILLIIKLILEMIFSGGGL